MEQTVRVALKMVPGFENVEVQIHATVTDKVERASIIT
jgi:hypothetical protein